jgi:hypothetical protein
MRKMRWGVWGTVVALCVAAGALAAASSQVDDDLTAQRRLFGKIGPGLRALKRGADGKYYILASPGTGLAIFDAQGKQLSVIEESGAAGTGAAAPAATAAKTGKAAITYGEDCDVDKDGTIYVADSGANAIQVLKADGSVVKTIPVPGIVSVASLPEGEIAVTTARQAVLVTIYGPDGHIAREFGNPEEVATRKELNRYLNLGRVSSDPQGRLYYGYTYMPEPLVRQYSRFGFAGQDFEFTGIDAYPEGSTLRKEIDRQDKRVDAPYFHPILTAFGVDPASGDVWMATHNTLLHFDHEGNRQSEYEMYTKDGVRLEANVILVEEDRLLIGGDPVGIYEFVRPDRRR